MPPTGTGQRPSAGRGVVLLLSFWRSGWKQQPAV